jgi:hypothetical protein
LADFVLSTFLLLRFNPTPIKGEWAGVEGRPIVGRAGRERELTAGTCAFYRL